MAGQDAMEPSKATPSKGANGLSSGFRFLNMFRSPSKVQASIDAAQQQDEEIMVESDPEQVQENMAMEESPEAHLPLVPTNSEADEVIPVPVQPSNGKRPVPRDEFDVPADDDEPPPKKSRKVHPKASKGLIKIPKTSNGAVPGKVHQTRGSRAPSNPPQSSAPVSESERLIANGHAGEETEQPRKETPKKRGRPPGKNKAAVRVAQKKSTPAPPNASGAPRADGVEASPAASDSEEGVSGMLDDPTPEKPPNSSIKKSQHQQPARKLKNMGAKATRPAVVEGSGNIDGSTVERTQSVQRPSSTQRSKTLNHPTKKRVIPPNSRNSAAGRDLVRAEYSEEEEQQRPVKRPISVVVLPEEEIEEEEDKEEEEEDDDEEEEGWEEEVDESDDEPLNDEQPLIQILFLKDLLAISQRVGRKEDGLDNWEWQEVRGNKEADRTTLYTIPGKRIVRRTEWLSKRYDALREAREADHKYDIWRAHTGILSIHKSLGEELETMRNTRLETSEAVPGKITRALEDIYFNIVPRVLQDIVDYAELHVIGGSMKDKNLQGFYYLILCFYNLARSATQLPKELQPQPKSSSKAKTYQISKPTRTVVACLAPFLKKVEKELLSREKAKIAAERGRIAASQAEERAEEDLERDMELKRAIDERNELLNKAWEKKLQEPVWGELKRKAIAKEVGVRSRSKPVDPARFMEEEEVYANSDAESDDPFAEDYVVPSAPVRLSSKKAKNPGQPRELSRKEMETFIEIMREGHGDDKRYWRASVELSRDFDEILGLAKDFQESMDDDHERGNYNEPYDEWTYHVFVERDGTAA